MKRNFYIFTPGKLRRKDNTVSFRPFEQPAPEDDENLQNDILLGCDNDDDEMGQRTYIPVNEIDSFFIMTTVTFNSKFIDFCAQNAIPVHFFNYFGFYDGSFYPRETLLSGSLLVEQVKHYNSLRKRMAIAVKFIEGAAYNILKNLKYYNSRDRDLQSQIDTIESLSAELKDCADIVHLMNLEGRIRKVYYSAFDLIVKADIKLEGRNFNPPANELNALISYANSLVYTSVLSEIYRTQLNPTVSYLHEPGVRRFSLALDIAEIFKPVFADRIIFKMLNNEQIKPNDFERELKGCYMKESGRKAFVQEFDAKLKTVVKHKDLGREVSYRRIIRLECYKLIKHIIGEKDYEPFKIWW